MPARRRSFTPAEKLRIVREADACVARGDVEAMLRREGIYSSHLATWRKALARHGVEGLAARRPGRKPKRDAKGSAHRHAREKECASRGATRPRPQAARSPKKASEILGVDLPTPPEEI
jgi:transposase-like protein